MSTWFIIALAVLAAIGVLLLLKRNKETRRSPVDPHKLPTLQTDFVKDREVARLANMSADDRAWETSSLQRNQAIQERLATLAK